MSWHLAVLNSVKLCQMIALILFYKLVFIYINRMTQSGNNFCEDIQDMGKWEKGKGYAQKYFVSWSLTCLNS